jgi:RimJ/RimL family protein N-acetyltransferase
MNDKIIYRKLGLQELEQYHYIRLDCLKNFPQNFGTLHEEELESSSFKFDKIITENHSSDFLMGAYKNKNLIGICGFIQEKRNKTKHIGEVSGMYVKPEYNGQHIGSELLKETIKISFENPEIEQIVLAVVDKNQVAKNLYKKNGFVEYGRLNNYFKHDGEYETQVFMTLSRQEK